MCTIAISDSVISKPGTTPARNNAPIETDLSPPHTTINMLGGMMTPMTDEQAVMATEKLAS